MLEIIVIDILDSAFGGRGVHGSTMANKASRSFCFTSYLESEPHVSNRDLVRYAIWGLEVCPDTGRDHWQGYVELFKPSKIPAVQAALEIVDCHLERRNGERDEARTYCMKDGVFSEYGTWISGQGDRTDWDDFREDCRTKDERGVMEIHPEKAVKYPGAPARIRRIYTDPRNWKTEVILFVGESGSGKSRMCRVLAETKPYTFSSTKKGWWPGYIGQEDVIFEEMGNWMAVEEFLEYTDRNECIVNMKGAEAQFVPRRIWINSISLPNHWWNMKGLGNHSYDEIYRRIAHIVHCLPMVRMPTLLYMQKKFLRKPTAVKNLEGPLMEDGTFA